MRKYIIKTFLVSSILFFSWFSSTANSATSFAAMNDYCQMPTYLSSAIRPNVLLNIDVSGSMGWEAYSYWGASYDSGTVYEGYFIPSKTYEQDANGIWTETTTAAGDDCEEVCKSWWWWWCVDWEWVGTCTGALSGNRLNYDYMDRIDLVRWVMTGGTPDSCNGNGFKGDYCDPELWEQSGNSNKVGAACNDALDVNDDGIADGGCILRTNDGERVKVPWSRVYDGLVYKLKELEVMPRMGAIFYSSSGLRDEKVYVGDFTAAQATSDEFPFLNLITNINSSSPSGGTPTGPAMRDALNYFAQNAPQYNGFPVQTGGGDRWKNPIYVCENGGGGTCEKIPCAKNFVILLSDGDWNQGEDPVVPAYEMHMGFNNALTGDSTSVSSVYSIALFLDSAAGVRAMKNVAMYGSFEKLSTWPGGTSGYPSSSLSVDVPDPSSADWDENSDGIPDTSYEASNAEQIREVILKAIFDILRQTSSGTSASVLASGEGSGASLLQAVFHPQRRFGDTIISWTGMVQDLWYYVDPFMGSSSIREDTNSDKILDLSDDYVASLYYDEDEQKTKAALYSDDDADGDGDTYVGEVAFENMNKLWEAGELLWARDISTDPRTIYTQIDGSNLTEISYANASDSAAALYAYMDPVDVDGGGSMIDDAEYIIKYIHGEDFLNMDRDGNNMNDFRSRTVSIGNVSNVWKLGDVINSTPKIVSFSPMNKYHLLYKDDTYGPPYNPSQSSSPGSSFITTSDYKARGMVFVGGNDGMLHAFKLGTLTFDWTGKGANQKAKLDGTNLGKEMWAFVPKNVLPFLKYIPQRDYCHVYSVDLTPYVFDASVNSTSTATGTKTASSWSTILIGGMRLGGGCRKAGTCSAGEDCVNTPTLDPDGNGLGYSSYFALDITDPEAPELLWEFSHDQLGFASSSPEVIRVGDKDTNGSWFVVFGSGPTGPIDQYQFFGRSDQNLKFFVLDLWEGDKKTGYPVIIDTLIGDAFSGPLARSADDADKDYQDDVIYAGYVKRKAGTGGDPDTWVDGGVGRLVTYEDPDPNKWEWKTLMDGIGPVTSGVSWLVDRKKDNLWLYFGTGRFFFDLETEKDDPNGQRRIFGIKEPCFASGDLDFSSCTPSVVNVSALSNEPVKCTSSGEGWYLDLDPTGSYTYNGETKTYNAERLITTPVAGSNGVVYFASFKPYDGTCSSGGVTIFRGIEYCSGGCPDKSSASRILMQLSTGSIEEVDILGCERCTENCEDVPPPAVPPPVDPPIGSPPQGDGGTVEVKPPPVNRTVHTRDRL